MRRSRATIRARLEQAAKPVRDGRFPLDIVIDGAGARFPANQIDTVLRELVKVRSIF